MAKRWLFILCVILWLQPGYTIRLRTKPKISDFDTVTRLLRQHHSNKVLLASIGQTYEVVYPERVQGGKDVGITTRETRLPHSASQSHYKHVIFIIDVGGQQLELNLTLNEVLLSGGITIKHYLSHDQQLFSSGVENSNNCYYQGTVSGPHWSAVAVSTCHGIRGVIQLQNETYVIQPLIGGDEQKHHPHVMYKESTPVKAQCGNKNGLWQPYSKLHKGDYIHELKFLKTKKMDRDGPVPTKLIHLALVLDSSFQEALNLTHSHMITYAIQMANMLDMQEALNLTHSHMITYAIQTANMLDMYYSSLKTDIVLVYAELWSPQRQQFVVSPVVRHTLHGFLKYKLKSLSHIQGTDTAHFLTTMAFEEDSYGMSMPDSICTERAVGVSSTRNVFEPQKLLFSLAHMLAHNLGIKHDDDSTCVCGDGESACIMASRVQRWRVNNGRQFSSCSRRDLDLAVKTGLASCLLGKAPKTFLQTCGNNHVERGEECDCGSHQDCASHDPCCDPDLCILKSWATCHDGPCCHNCTLLPPTQLCRDRQTECDVPEYCDGRVGQCPRNDYIHDGYPCHNRTGYCYAGLCPTLTQQCQAIWGKNASLSNRGCYERFNPSGMFNGHCGRDSATGQFIQCSTEDVMCGLLHCEGGSASPVLGHDKNAFSKTTMSFGNLQYDCKIVHGPTALDIPHMGIVQDGSQCDDNSICRNKRCVPLVKMDLRKCMPKGGAVLCSGRGICTNSRRCHCDAGFAGKFCTQKVTTAIISSPTHTTTTLAPFNRSFWFKMENMMTRPILPVVSVTHQPEKETKKLSTTCLVIILVEKETKKLSTTWLVIILVGVVVSLVLIFAIGMIFCRRRSNPHKMKSTSSKSSVYSSLSLNPSKASASIIKHLPTTKKSIKLLKFGSLPAKLPSTQTPEDIAKKKKRMSSGDDSDLGELPPPPIIVVSPNSAKPPERGILKNSTTAPERYLVRGSELAADSYAALDEFMPNSKLLCDGLMCDYEGDVDAELQKILDCDEVCSCSDGDFDDDGYENAEMDYENASQIPTSESFDFVLPAPPRLGSPGCRDSVSDREYCAISNAKLAGGIVDYSFTPETDMNQSNCCDVERGREMIASLGPSTLDSPLGFMSPSTSRRDDIDLSPSPEQRLISYEQELASPNLVPSVSANQLLSNLPHLSRTNSRKNSPPVDHNSPSPLSQNFIKYSPHSTYSPVDNQLTYGHSSNVDQPYPKNMNRQPVNSPTINKPSYPINTTKHSPHLANSPNTDAISPYPASSSTLEHYPRQYPLKTSPNLDKQYPSNSVNSPNFDKQYPVNSLNSTPYHTTSPHPHPTTSISRQTTPESGYPETPTIPSVCSPVDSGSWHISPHHHDNNDLDCTTNHHDNDLDSASYPLESCEKSSGYGSEHDLDPHLRFYRPLLNNREKSESPPKFSSVIRTGPNRIELISPDNTQLSKQSPVDASLPPQNVWTKRPSQTITKQSPETINHKHCDDTSLPHNTPCVTPTSTTAIKPPGVAPKPVQKSQFLVNSQANQTPKPQSFSGNQLNSTQKPQTSSLTKSPNLSHKPKSLTVNSIPSIDRSLEEIPHTDKQMSLSPAEQGNWPTRPVSLNVAAETCVPHEVHL